MSQPLLVAQHEALNDFLDDLLTEDVDDSHPVVDESSTAAGLSDEAKAATPSTDGPQPVSPETAETVLSDSVNSGNTLPPFTDDGRIPVLPDWGLQAFQAMVFKVGELSLAIPLTELAGVIKWRPERVEGPSANGLYLGHYQHDDQSVSVVDIARLVFAGNRFDYLIKTEASQRLTRIILINNAKWGLACDAVYEVITIQPTRVNWRSTRTRRQWLAGTLLDDMIVVLDVQSMTRILSDMLVDLE